MDDKTGKYGEYKLLFNLKDDLNETTNLADKYPQKVKELEDVWSINGQRSMTDPKWPTRKSRHLQRMRDAVYAADLKPELSCKAISPYEILPTKPDKSAAAKPDSGSSVQT